MTDVSCHRHHAQNGFTFLQLLEQTGDVPLKRPAWPPMAATGGVFPPSPAPHLDILRRELRITGFKR